MAPKKNTMPPTSNKANNKTKTETTAASERPSRRSSAVAQPASEESVKAPSTTPKPTAKRGRPRREPQPAEQSQPEEGIPEKKKRGRPAKVPVEDEPPKKRSRGDTSPLQPVADETPTSRTRRDARETPTVEREVEAVDEAEDRSELPPKRKRGRPSKTVDPPAPAVPVEQKPPPRPRGRPPKGGETTKISADDEAAAKQLEEELHDSAEGDVSPIKKKKTGPALDKKTKGKAKTKLDDGNDLEDAGEESPVKQQYWLMKAEQEDRFETLKSGRQFNTKFTIDDLSSKTVPEPWDGVRNPVAAKNMRNMKKGDMAFFYASGGKAGRTPGITGIMEIVGEHEPDVTTADDDAYGYVEKESDRDKWCIVSVEFRKKLSKPVTLKELQKYTQDRGALSDMQVLKQSRLSVTHVTEKEWNFIVDSLIEGYEDT